MKKIDLKKQLRLLYSAKAGVIDEITVPAMNYLMVDGSGDPNTSENYTQAVEALFSVSYALKFHVKKGPEAINYGVMPLEGLWWADNIKSFETGDKSDWKWTVMILQPQFVTMEKAEMIMSQVQQKKNLPALSLLRFETFEEGKCAQTLHVGPFSEEGPTIAELHEYIDAHGTRTGKHHEIYLSDIRRAAPRNWKTIIRQPFAQ